MAVNLSPVGGVAAQFFDNDGNVLSGGKIYTYGAGSSTPAVTYTNAAGVIQHSNPIILDSAGRVPGGEIWLTDGIQYKFVLNNSVGTLIGTYDNIIGINSNFLNFLAEQEIQTATAGQTVFTLTTTEYQPGTNTLSVFVDGVNQYGPGAQYAYTETSSTVVTFVNGLHVGASVKFTTTQALSGGAVSSALVTYQPAGINAVATNVQAKLRQTVSVKDFGAVADGVTDNLLFFKAALQHLESIGGGALYCPAGTYATTKPIIVRSNIELFGDGAATIIKNINPAGYSPIGDCIHIGITNEWKDWEGNSGGITDANITQWDAGDYSYITTENVHVHDLTVASGAPVAIEGMGIWVVNSQNFVVENIWADRVSTPVSVANDNPTSYGGSRNGVVRAIFQVTAGRWYDLVYTGEAELIDISQCFNNPISNATLNTAIAIGGHSRFIRVHDNVIRFQNYGSRLAIDTSGPATANTAPNYFENNTIVGALVGVVTYQMNNQVVRNNGFYGCTQGIRVYSSGQIIDGNTFQNCTYDIYFQSGSNANCLNMILSYSRLGEESAGIINNSNFFRNCVGVGGLRFYVYHPIDYVIAAPDVAEITSEGAVITTLAGATAEFWFRLPDNMYQLNDLSTYWYANAAGEVLLQKVYKRTTFANNNSFIQVGTTKTYTSSGSGDQSSTWSGINETVANVETAQTDQYYVQLTTTFASASSQLRASQVSYRSFGTNQ
jgi:parallel beta-helix repeat protein